MNEQRYEFADLCPRELADNMDCRRQLLTLAYSDRQIQKEIWIMSSRDPLFFCNANCWILESRDSADWQVGGRIRSREVPFILRPYQEQAIRDVIGSLGREDIVAEKSREVGATWIFIMLMVWGFLFSGQEHCGVVSKDELSVDNPDDPDSLFSKFEFLLKRLPQWMQPRTKRNHSDHTWKNLENESTITGYAATGNVARGGRKRWMLFDEFHSFPAGTDQQALDSSVAVTDSRVFISTPNPARGTAGAYHELVTDLSRKALRLVIDWKDDIDKRRGLYHSRNIIGTDSYALILDDAEFWSQYANQDGTYRNPTKKGEQYKFVLDGKTRSLYYDAYCQRPGVTERSVASELDRNFTGATSSVCDLGTLSRAIDRAKAPFTTGEIYPNPEPREPLAVGNEWIFDSSIADGATKLWCKLVDGRPPPGEYSAGQDISAGTGGARSSYSAIEIFDKKTGEHVFELRSNRIDPIRFAGLAIWVCRWFWDAYMVPETNGPLGVLFLNEIIRMKYPHVYKRKPQRRRDALRGNMLGYFNSDQGVELLENMEQAITKKVAHVNSVLALREMSRYAYGADGKIHHSLEMAETDGSGKGKAHGDAAIALCAAWLGVEDWPAAAERAKSSTPPIDSYLWRQAEYQKQLKRQNEKQYWKSY